MIGLLVLPALLLAGPSVAEKRVHPVAIPSRPAPSERVVIRFRTRESLDGVYHAEAKLRGCDTARGRSLIAPAKGRVVRLVLAAPRAGWCTGEHRATVVFQQTVRCPPPIQCGDSAEVPIGSTTFTVP
ncbi:MAG TPA: hypothetical protein VI300_18265 [Solirubrobacter sp.]